MPTGTGRHALKLLATGGGPLSERNFRNLFFGRATSLFGDALVPVALAFAVLEVNNSAAALGGVLAARSIALIGFLMVAGVVADRLPRRQVLMWSDLVRFGAQATTAALLVTGAAELWHLVVLALIYGLGDAFFRPTSTAIVPQMVSAPRLQEANALIAFTQSATIILGPVVAGVLVAAVGAGWALALDALTFLVSFAFVYRLPTIRLAKAAAAPFVRELREGWAAFVSRKWLWIDGVFSALSAFAVLAPFWVLGPVIADRSLGGAPAWAAIVTAFGIGSVAGALVLMRVKPERPLVTAVSPLVLLAAPLALLALQAPVAVIAVGAFAGGMGLATFNTLFETTVQRSVPPETLSRIASIDWMLSGALMPLGYAAAGPVSEAIGTDTTLAFSAVFIVVSTLIVLSVREIREFRSEPPGPASPGVSGTAQPA